jgi:hypothetical protein
MLDLSLFLSLECQMKNWCKKENYCWILFYGVLSCVSCVCIGSGVGVGAGAGVGVGAGLGSALNVSTNFVSVSSGMNFCMSKAMPRLAIWMPSM